jgi:hypothetical protein
MGLHLCFDLAAPGEIDAGGVVDDLRRFASALPFAGVSRLLGSADGDHHLPGSSWLLPLDAAGQPRARDEAESGGPLWSALPVEPIEWWGFSVDPGSRTETATFGLARHPSMVTLDGREVETMVGSGWRWQGCCKTQYASTVSWEHFMTVHGSLVSVLDRAAAAGILSEVRDETGFWSDRDWRVAAQETERMNLVVRLIADRIEEALRDEHD